MKYPIVVLFLCLSGFIRAQGIFNPDDLQNIARAEQARYAGNLLMRGQSSSLNFDVTYYRCHWNIDPAERFISGEITTIFTPVESAFTTMELAMFDGLTVDSVVYRHLTVPFNHASDVLKIHFPAELPQHIPDSVSVYYKGIPADNGSGSFVQEMHDDIPVIWTLSQPYGSGDWWPCKDGLTDKADSVDIFVKTPAAYTVASNGILASVIPDGTSRIFHWKHRYPIATYLICFTVTNYAKYWHRVPFGPDTLEVVNYVYPEDSLSVLAQTGVIVPLIQLFDTLFGIYPFQNEQYGHAQFGWGGGMEHQTMTFVASFGFELLAHELAHHWFGNKVTCGSWTDIWLNEGYATYLSGLAYEHLLPEWWQQFKKVRINSITSKPGGSVWCDDTTSISRIFDGRLSYAKGGMILHQLRWIIGDSAFFAASNNFLNDIQYAYGFARTSDLKAHFEASYGQDLTWYFDDWFTGEGYPSYHIGWSQAGSELHFTINQTQSHESVPFFELPVPLMFKNQTRDTLIRVNNTYSGQEVTITLPFTADTLIVDPEYWLISRDNITNTVREIDLHDEIGLYPNPAGDFIIVTIKGNRKSLPYVIYSLDGKKIQEGYLSGEQDKISTTSLPKGMYSLEIQARKGSQVRSFLKDND